MTTIGMNLAANSYYSGEYPWIDRMHAAGQWVADRGGALQYDANGNPLAIMPAGSTYISFAVGLDLPALSTVDDYVLTWDGDARITFDGGTVISQTGNRMVIHATRADGMLQVSMSSINAANPPSNFHIVRADQVDLYNAGKLFNPAFLAVADDWSVLRFMDWSQTNGSTVATWAQRATPDQISWSDGRGVPIEVMVQLSNEVHKDLWINIPALADDDYVRRMLSYVHDHLDAALKVHVEYSNETWNWGFQQTTQSQERANALWGTDANHDGVINRNDPAENVSAGYEVYYGYRAAQIAAMGNDIFGSDGARLKMVLATQTNWAGLENAIFDGVARANVGSVGTLFDEYAVTTYFGNMLSGGTVADQARVLGWARSGAAGLDAVFQELSTGGALTSNDSLAWLRTMLAYQHGVAERYGLSLVAYEGGLHFTATSYDAGVRGEIVDFMSRLQADPRMAQLYTQMVGDFGAAGGDLLVAYDDVGKASIYGTWGLIDNIYASSDRYNTLAAMNNDTTVDVSTALASFALGSEQHTLSYTGTGAFSGNGNALDNVLIGGNGGATLYGRGGNDTLVGGTGNDYLDGGTGADRMTGGLGNDIYVVDDAGDVIVEYAGGGTDEVRTALTNYTLPDVDVENLTTIGAGAFSGTGNALANVITGNTTAANNLFGMAGNDTLIGGAGADYLDGGTGADRMVGGAGDDVYIVDNAADVVVEIAYQGNDEVRTTLASYTLGDNIELLTYAGNGSFAGTGNALANTIRGSAVNSNILDGGLGADTLIGGSANDIYVVDNLGDVIVEAANGGVDEVRTTLNTYMLGSNLENLTYMGTQSFAGTGNALANTITGGAANDTLDGGAGADRLIGGGGNDIYIIDNALDVIVEQANGGNDLAMVSAARYTLSANVENMTFTGVGAFTGVGNASDNVITGSLTGPNRLTGGDGRDTLTGGAYADVLDGGTGADTMRGGAGNDVYYVDDVNDMIFEYAGGGLDEVRSTALTYALSAEIENLTFVGVGNFTGTGNAGNNMITGGLGNDTLSGGEGDDILIGGVGNDTLLGGWGADRMIGGLGDDTYDVWETSDIVLENAGEGIDTVRSRINYTLGDNVENLVLYFSGGNVGTGNALDNVLTSVGGDDRRLYGVGGNDTLNGGSGNDLLDGGDGDDTIYGNDGLDWLTGGAGNDRLDGGNGNDRLIGGTGKDMLTGGAGADVFQFAPGDLASTAAATDVVTDFNRGQGDTFDFTVFRGTAPLSFLGTGAFTRHAGEMRYQASGNQLDLSIDLNGDGVADIHLMIASATNDLVRADFVF